MRETAEMVPFESLGASEGLVLRPFTVGTRPSCGAMTNKAQAGYAAMPLTKSVTSDRSILAYCLIGSDKESIAINNQ